MGLCCMTNLYVTCNEVSRAPYRADRLMIQRFRVKLAGGFRKLAAAGDSQPWISFCCQLCNWLLVPVNAFYISIRTIIVQILPKSRLVYWLHSMPGLVTIISGRFDDIAAPDGSKVSAGLRCESEFIQIPARFRFEPDFRANPYIGFRCAWSP